MARTLAGALAWLIYPSQRRKPTIPFRFSHAINEAGSYETVFGRNWQPLRLKGDPPIKYDFAERKSRKFFDAFVPLIPQRAALARQVLLDWGAIKEDYALTQYYDWKLVESVLERKIEFANGDDVFLNDEWPRVRPSYYAFMLDLCCLAHVSALKANPDARSVFQNDIPAIATMFPRCFPVIMIGSRYIGSLFEPSWKGGLVAAKPGEQIAQFASLFHVMQTPYKEPTPAEEEAELHAWLDDIVADTGQLPDENEFIAMMTDSKIAFDEIPNSIWERLNEKASQTDR